VGKNPALPRILSNTLIERKFSMPALRLHLLAWLFLALAPAPAAALSLLPPVAAVAAEPAVAAPGVPRKIVVAGLWPTACVPTHAQLGVPPSWGATQGIGILLAEPLTFAPCAAALTPYRFELDYTPSIAGQVEILVMTTQAAPLATGTLVTGDAATPKARYDVTGAWFDPATLGSGLQVVHDFGQGDELHATWQVFDPATGRPTWYTVQQGRWDADGLVWTGFVYEIEADPSGCTAPCASPFSHVAFLGAARLTFSPSFVHGGLDATMDLLPDGITPRRVANLTRFLPRRVVIQ
jgi:hypothetical protein